MAIIVGTVVPNPEYHYQDITVQVMDNGTVRLGRGAYYQNEHKMPPEVALQLADLLRSAAAKSSAVVRAAAEAKQLQETLKQTLADRMAAIAEGHTMKVHMNVELESDDGVS